VLLACYFGERESSFAGGISAPQSDEQVILLAGMEEGNIVLTSSKLRRAAAAGGCVLTAGLGALAGSGVAQAQAATTGRAPVADATVSHDGGRLMRIHAGAGTFAPDAWAGCNAGFFCLSPFSNPLAQWKYSSPNATLAGAGYSTPWGQCGSTYYPYHPMPGCDVGIHSWSNNTGDRVWLKATPTGGSELCISNHTSDLNYNGIADNDFWVQITQNPNPC
jgi:hypothetical protein